ncbi:MAG TPA: LemA family protein, partial [Candidatus Paceibacterota bacterium]|nr:LemA family protein [Candidatus Paceibacterota bacterium]
MSTLTIIIIVAAVLVLWVIMSYNSLIRLVTQAKEAWADIEVQLKRRYDLIPNLVATVKGYATHESSAFEKVTTARTTTITA